jgi:proteasome lid subunit RPN8/RPN11
MVLARPSTTKPLKQRRSAINERCEECWALVGRRQGRIWFARQIARCTGDAASVAFDALAILEREERSGDVIGFLHTHPTFIAQPSQRDLNTMRAWVSAFGKPLLCVIQGTDGLAAYRFDDTRSLGDRLQLVEAFPRGVLIGVDGDGR